MFYCIRLFVQCSIESESEIASNRASPVVGRQPKAYPASGGLLDFVLILLPYLTLKAPHFNGAVKSPLAEAIMVEVNHGSRPSTSQCLSILHRNLCSYKKFTPNRTTKFYFLPVRTWLGQPWFTPQYSTSLQSSAVFLHTLRLSNVMASLHIRWILGSRARLFSQTCLFEFIAREIVSRFMSTFPFRAH